jgi:hypothetical protein
MHHVPNDITIEIVLKAEERMARETVIREALHQGSSPWRRARPGNSMTLGGMDRFFKEEVE